MIHDSKFSQSSEHLEHSFTGLFVDRSYESNIDLSTILTAEISNHPILLAIIDACLELEGIPGDKDPSEFKIAHITVTSKNEYTKIVTSLNNGLDSHEIIVENCNICGTPIYCGVHINNGCSVFSMMEIMNS
jgi:hypothetical protein